MLLPSPPGDGLSGVGGQFHGSALTRTGCGLLAQLAPRARFTLPQRLRRVAGSPEQQAGEHTGHVQ